MRHDYLNRIQSSRRLEREAERNVELMWLTGRLAPDFKTLAGFRQDNIDLAATVRDSLVQLTPWLLNQGLEGGSRCCQPPASAPSARR
nr:transposase [Pseudomonas chlororaphis]